MTGFYIPADSGTYILKTNSVLHETDDSDLDWLINGVYFDLTGAYSKIIIGDAEGYGWYKMDIGNKAIYIKQPEDGDILAEARVSENGGTNAKIYTYSEGTWSTSNQYADIPGGETSGTVSVPGAGHGEPAYDNGVGMLNIINDVIVDVTEKVNEIKETILDSFAFDPDYMSQEDWDMVTLGITTGVIDSVFPEASIWNPASLIINKDNVKSLVFTIAQTNETTARDNYYYINSKTGTEYCIMITAKIIEVGSTSAAIVALTQAGISFKGGLAIFAGTGGLASPIAVSIEVESAGALVVSGVCALAGVSAGIVYENTKGIFENDIVKCAEVNSNIYSGELKKVDDPDPAADALAQRIGGQSRVKFSNDPDGREFDVISDLYIAEAKPALSNISKKIRIQMKMRFEAAKATGRKVYYHFEGQPCQEAIDKLHEYSLRYGVEVIIDTNPLFK